MKYCATKLIELHMLTDISINVPMCAVEMAEFLFKEMHTINQYTY